MSTPPITPEPVLSKTLIPQDLHDRGWAKPLLEKPWSPEVAAEVFKKLDGAETLIGKKTLIPGADAKPEEWDGFIGKLRAEKPEDYEVKLGEKGDPEWAKALQTAFHKSGTHKVQAAKFLAEIQPVLAAREKAQAEKIAARDAEFAGLLEKMTGPEFEKKSSRVQNAVRELVPEEARKFVEKIDDKSLALFVSFADALLSKYAGEDEFMGGGNGGGAGGDSTSLTAEMHKLLASDAWKDFRHADHAKTKARFEEITALLGK